MFTQTYYQKNKNIKLRPNRKKNKSSWTRKCAQFNISTDYSLFVDLVEFSNNGNAQNLFKLIK